MLHILEVKWKRNQNADMIYKDFYPFYASYANPMLYRGEKEQEEEFSLMKSYYPETAEGFRRKWKKNVIFWITRAAGCTMNIRTATCCIILAGRSWMMSARRQVWKLCQTVFWRILFRCFYFTKYHADGAETQMPDWY